MLNFLYVAVSWVLLRWHDLFDAIGLSVDWSWTLSVIFLVITARVLLFRLFVKQVHYQRNMQKMQPKIQKLREKYKDDRGELNRQMMKLQQDEGFNPLTGCLPMFLQIPVFLGLYHVLRHLSNSFPLCDGARRRVEPLLPAVALHASARTRPARPPQAKLLGAPLAPRSATPAPRSTPLGGANPQAPGGCSSSC